MERTVGRLFRGVQDAVKELSIEPILFLYFVGMYTRLVVKEDLKLDRFCRITLQYDEDDCAHLNDGHHDQIQVETQKLDSVFTFYEKLVSTIVPVLLLSFLASWSERRGRKMLLLLCFIGESLYNAVYVLASLFVSWPAKVLLVAAFLQSVGGGIMMLFVAAYSFMSDKTGQGSRTFRMIVMNAIMHLGGPVGTALGAWVFTIKSYVWVFSLSLVISLICFILVIVLIKEEKVTPSPDDSNTTRAPWDPRNVVDLFRACFGRRPGRARSHLVLMMTIMLANMSTDPQNLYLWCRRVFLWDTNQYSLYSTINQVFEQATSLILAPIVHRLSLHDCTTGAGAMFITFVKLLSMGLTTSPSEWWVLYIFVINPYAFTPAIIRAILSKICNEDEVGRILAMLAILEILYPLANSALFTVVYTSTLDFYPSYEYLVAAAFAACAFSAYLGLRLSLEQEKKSVDGEDVVKEQETEEEPHSAS